MKFRIGLRLAAAGAVVLMAAGGTGWGQAQRKPLVRKARAKTAPVGTVTGDAFRFDALREAIGDLVKTSGKAYSRGEEFLARLGRLETRVAGARRAGGAMGTLEKEFRALQREALLANPAIEGMTVLCVRRRWANGVKRNNLKRLGIPSNHECHSVLPPNGWDNEIAVFEAADPVKTWRVVHRPGGGAFVGHVDLHWDAGRAIFTQTNKGQWSIWEMRLDGAPARAGATRGGGLRKVSKARADVNCFDACYLPDGRILCGSDGTAQCVPCWHGVDRKYVANLFVMNADGSNMRRVTFDQDHDTHPSVLANGQIVYQRWDYTGINRLFLRPLMVMNPDGTGQRALYGSNSWFPNGLYFPHELPGRPGRLVSVLAGYHGPGRTGHLVVVDTNKGTQEADGIVTRISGTGRPLDVKIMDQLTTDAWPKFHTPSPVTDKQFLVSAWMSERHRRMGIYLVDVFDNVVLLHEIEGSALLEPIAIVKRPTPPVLADRVDLSRDDATVYVQDVHFGPGLAGVPRGTVKRLRVIGYHFGYEAMAGNDKIGLSGPWDAMRILGTTPVEADGSAVFRVPANTPIAFQALDGEGKAVQLMRSWFTAMPGENVSCIGCHERAGATAPVRRSIASGVAPRALDQWYGPARGFDFAREVQPVLNRYCMECHNGKAGRPDLRPEHKVASYTGRVPGRLDRTRLHPTHRKMHGGKIRYTPAYEALLPYVRRVNIGDDVSLLPAGHYHADTSELVQMLRRAHGGVSLDPESWSRIVTWIDLNGPCHGTWRDVLTAPLPSGGHTQRMELFTLYGGPTGDPEAVAKSDAYDQTPVKPKPSEKPQPVAVKGWPFDGAARVKQMGPAVRREIDLGANERRQRVTLKLVKIPAGRFVMGDANGLADERPLAGVEISKAFWMGSCEISNEQFRQFRPSHDSGYYAKRHATRGDDKGMGLNDARQPALRVSWQDATAFCRWLSKRTGQPVALPTEAQWEYACRAGRADAMHYGAAGDDFAPWANLADKTFATYGYKGGSTYFRIAGDVDLIAAEGVDLAEQRYDDKGCMAMPIGSYRPNGFGLHDMHGNVAEWTASAYRAYPYRPADGRESPGLAEERAVRGGSFLDRPARCRSARRYSYPPWQKVHNVGFRIVVGP